MKLEIARGEAGRSAKHSGRPSVRPATTVVLLAMTAMTTMGGGCMRDCRSAYCDAVRAGATAVQAWHFHCCVGSESPAMPASTDCDDLPNRIARFSLLAAEAREVCEAQNWGRLRDIWREFRGLVPLRFVSTVWREACGDSIAWGENRWTPFGPDVGFSISIPFDVGEPPRIVFGDASDSRATVHDVTETVAWIERTRTSRAGSSVSMWLGERWLKATTNGRMVVATRVGSADPGAACEVSRPVEFRLDLQGDGWSGRVDLVEGFEGNRIIETNEGFEMLGMLVRIDVEVDEPIGISSAGIFDEAFIQLPVERLPGGSIRFGTDRLIDGLELLPVDPRLDSAYRSDPTDGVRGSGTDCGAFASARAAAFLDLHPGCRITPAIDGPVDD